MNWLQSVKRWMGETPERERARHLYIALVERARNPFFFTQAGVEDSLDGRFELIIMHLYAVLSCLRNQHAGFCQLLSEVFFEDLDRSLREMGMSDTGVPKRMRKMSEAFYGRIHAYDEAFSGSRSLEDAVRKNVYGKTDVIDAKLRLVTNDLITLKKAFSTGEAQAKLVDGLLPEIIIQDGIAA